MSTTGMPLSLKFSANTCSVLVFPVPVAPAIKPCLFIVFNGILMKAFFIVLLSNMAEPSVRNSPLKVFPSEM